MISAAILYDLLKCPHRVKRDLFDDPKNRDAVSAFVELLWERGNRFEKEVVANLSVPFEDYSELAGDSKETATRDALSRNVPLIYGGRLSSGDLVGEPDILRKDDQGYTPGDIKSGAGEQGPEEARRLKPHYGVQLALYADILAQLGYLSSRQGFIWDVHGAEVTYHLDEPLSPKGAKTLWEIYCDTLACARGIVGGSQLTEPAYGAQCKECHWYSSCLSALEKSDDLTLIPDLGRSKRDIMADQISTVGDLAACDITTYVNGKKTIFSGIGPATLQRFKARAELRSQSGEPYAVEPIQLPAETVELYFDIETDPMEDVCYLHGFVERRGGSKHSDQYHGFFANDPADEEEAFRAAWQYLYGFSSCALYYYSPYERTIYRHLQEKYPHVCSADEVNEVFARAETVDLLSVVRKSTIWPSRDHSIKTLARHLGFAWRDANPSGAASIEWWDRWLKTSDPAIKERILEYNEDDCQAMAVLADALKKMPVH